MWLGSECECESESESESGGMDLRGIGWLVGGKPKTTGGSAISLPPCLMQLEEDKSFFSFEKERRLQFSCTYLMFPLSKEKPKSIQLRLIFFGKGHTFYALINIVP